MYKIIMVSPGGTKKDFSCGYKTERGAEEFAEACNWEFYDENQFRWSLEVVEEEYYSFRIPDKTWAKTFLEFQEHGDDQALAYLNDIMKNTFNTEQRLKYLPLRRLVEAALPLNRLVTLMEVDEIPFDADVEEAYRILMTKLTKLAEDC